MFHVVAGAKQSTGRGTLQIVRSSREASRHHLLKYWLFSTGSINLGFLLRENLLLCSSYLPLGVPNWVVIYINTAPQSVGSRMHEMWKE
jgi:hypothetical protein